MTTVNVSSVSGSTVQATYLGASLAYPYPAPYGTVDSNSLFNGQVLTENTTWRFVTEFAHLTIDHTAAQAETPPYGNDINDHSTAEEGYEGEDTATIEVRYSDGSTAQFTATATVAQPATAPTEAPVIGTITTTDTTASIPFGAVTGATGYEYSADGTTWTDATSPIELTGLTAETAYSGYHVRGKNSAGPGPTSTFGFTTNATVLNPPSGTIAFETPTVTQSTISQPTSYSGSDATSFQYRVNGGAWTTYTSPISLADLDPSTDCLIGARAVNADGNGPEFTTTVSTLAAPDYAITVTSRSTSDKTPLIYGYLGDAINPSVNVDGTDYTPNVNGTQWSVTVGELTIGAYTVTLSADDASGTALDSVTGELIILPVQTDLPGRRIGKRKSAAASVRSAVGKSIHRGETWH